MEDYAFNEFEKPENYNIEEHISKFESGKNYKAVDYVESAEDQDSDEGFTSEDKLQEKNKILMDHLIKKFANFRVNQIRNEELEKYKGMVELVEKGDSLAGNKEKKLINLAKNNRNLKLQIESLKTKAAKAMDEVFKLREQNKNLESQQNSQQEERGPNKIIDPNKNYEKEIEALNFNLQKSEGKIQRLKKREQELNAQYKKALLVIKREVGEEANIDLLLKTDSDWKGRAEKIQKLQAKLPNSAMNKTNLSSISGMSATSVSFSTRTDKSLVGDTDRKRKEIEKLSEENKELKSMLKDNKLKYAASTSRISSMEKEVREIKTSESSKFKIFVEKAETDDKLIEGLKLEIKKLKLNKKSNYNPAKGDYEKEYNRMEDELTNLNADKTLLEEELKKKSKKINELLLKVMEKGSIAREGGEDESKTGPSRRAEDKALIKNLQAQIEQLKKTPISAHPPKRGIQNPQNNIEHDKIIKDLSSQNARLRNKLDDLQQKLFKLQK